MRKLRKGRVTGPGRTIGRLSLLILVGSVMVLVPAFGEVPSFSLAQDRIPPSPADLRLPSEETAMLLSILGSVGAVASVFSENPWVVLGGLGFGPSLGFFYAGCWGRGLLSAGLRVGVTIGLVALAYDADEVGGLALAWLGGMSASIIFDLATLKRTVRKNNAKIAARRGVTLDVAPFAVPKGGGVQVRLSF